MYVFFSENLVAAKQIDFNGNNKWGYIDKTNKVIIPLKFDRAEEFSEDMAAVGLADANGYATNWGYINTIGQIVIPNIYPERLGPFKNGFTVVGIRGERGVINKEGKIIIPLKYDNISHFDNGLAKAEKNGKFGLINEKGDEIISLKYEELKQVGNGFTIAKRN